MRWLPCQIIGLLSGFVVVGCAPKHVISSEQPEIEAEILDVARAAGAQVRVDRRAFVVYPAFLDARAIFDASPNAPGPDAVHKERATRVLEAFRRGAGPQLADTSRYSDLAAVAAFAESLRDWVTLTAEPTVKQDSAFVDVFSYLVLTKPGPVEMATYRYFFVRRDGAWHFVRRVMTDAT